MTSPDSSASPGARIPECNNFDLLRFCFAAIVFLVHAHALSGSAQLSWLSRVLSSEVAVRSFFIVSGFLIFMSYEKSHGLRNYFEKRARRIYPAYFTIVMLCAVLGALLGTHAPLDYLLASGVYKYLAANLVFLNFVHPVLPGVFTGNALQAVNGALWTLKIEVMFYLSVPLLAWLLQRIGRWQGLVLLYAISFAYSFAMGELAQRGGGGIYLELQRQLPGQLMYFMAGAALFYYHAQFAGHWKPMLALALGIMLLGKAGGFGFAEPAALAVLVIYAACVFPYLGNFGKFGDFSYGVYIVHFPILQALIALGVFRNNPWSALLLASALVMLGAFLMWHLVEKRFLRKSSHYVAVNR